MPTGYHNNAMVQRCWGGGEKYTPPLHKHINQKIKKYNEPWEGGRWRGSCCSPQSCRESRAPRHRASPRVAPAQTQKSLGGKSAEGAISNVVPDTPFAQVVQDRLSRSSLLSQRHQRQDLSPNTFGRHDLVPELSTRLMRGSGSTTNTLKATTTRTVEQTKRRIGHRDCDQR